ncbi:MAG: glutamate--tRNA ligase [Candidatus Paceibacterota bacterium]|jgi:glutamyl-tRNA synthetase
MNKKVITRFAPSPTGFLHAGAYRTAIFNFLFARHHGGKFVLRIEDTDKARSTKEFEDNILDSLQWLGLTHDEFFRQSERTEIYKKYLQKLIDDGFAYISKEEVKKEGDRDSVIRFKNPNKKVSWHDLIRGDIEFDTTELGDFVIAKDLNEPIFHLVVVVDDFEMGITHIIRGEDHISNTPRHILIQQAIGAPTPEYAHLPLILSPDRTKLSKRKGALPLTAYREKGYLKEALLNYISMLGWNPGDDRELLSENELINLFSLERVQKSGAIFDEVKLLWINKEYMKKIPDDEFIPEVLKHFSEEILVSDLFEERKSKVFPLIRERISTFGEIDDMVKNGELDYFFLSPTLNKEMILVPEKMRKGKEVNEATTANILEKVAVILETIDENDFTKEKVKEIVFPYAEEEGRGIVLWPMRVALSGKEKSPDPFELSDILGKKETILRIKNAVELMRS